MIFIIIFLNYDLIQLKLADDIELTLRVLEGEEEKTFLDKAVEQMKNRRNQGGRHKGGHFRGVKKRRLAVDESDLERGPKIGRVGE